MGGGGGCLPFDDWRRLITLSTEVDGAFAITVALFDSLRFVLLLSAPGGLIDLSA